MTRKIKVHESYYVRNPNEPEEHVLPKIMRKMPTETEADHSSRVKDYLILLNDEQFSAFGYKIDSSDPKQEQFLHFYNEMMAQRAEVKRN